MHRATDLRLLTIFVFRTYDSKMGRSRLPSSAPQYTRAVKDVQHVVMTGREAWCILSDE
jgi:hypothetical protein